MEITYRYFFAKEEKTHHLREFIMDVDYEGEVERAVELARRSIQFTEKVVEILYKKNILTKEDIANIVDKFDFNVDKDSVKIEC